MASALRIVDLNGKVINVVKGPEQTWREVVEKAKLPARFDFCLRHWLGDEDIDSQAEQRIKEYLDRVGYILIQDKPDSSILTDYKELRDKVALIPVSGYPQLENMFYGSLDEMKEGTVVPGRESGERMTKVEIKIYNALTRPKRTPRAITRLKEKRSRIDRMRNEHPGANITFACVDTENVFTFRGQRWQIDDIPQYRAKNVNGDDLYDMDHVTCVASDAGVYFYDQDFVEITDKVKRM